MRKIHNEQGYALLIVLFLVVFIMAVSAVFIRGSLGNAKQEIKVDESHLTVMAAEAGVDYYTWILKKVYNATDIQGKIDKKIKDAIENKSQPIKFEKIQEEVAIEFINELHSKADFLTNMKYINISEGYSHKLHSANTEEKELANGDREITMVGKVIGVYNGVKDEQLTFHLVFTIPKIFSGNGNAQDVVMPENLCKETVNIVNEKCLFPANKTSSLKSVSDNSIVYLDGKYSGYENIKMVDSYFRMSEFVNGSYWDVQKSKLFIEGSLNKYGNTKMVGSISHINGDFNESGFIDFLNSDIFIGKSFLGSSGGSKIQDSRIYVGTNFNNPNKITVQKTNFTVGGFMKFDSGGDLIDSRLKTGGYLLAPTKLTAKNSEIKIGDYLQLDSGGDFQYTNMIVKSYLKSPSALYLANSNIIIGNNLELNTQSQFENTVLKVDKKLSTPNKIVVKNSVIIGKDTGIAILDLKNTTFCAENLNINNISMDGSSKIYFLSSSNVKEEKNKIIKLQKNEYDQKCNFDLQINDPELPKSPQNQSPIPNIIDWLKYKPSIEKVDYN